MNGVKSFLASRMFWTGAMMILGAIAEAIATGGDLRTVSLAAFGALVIWLRKHTSSGMDFSLPRPRHCSTCLHNDEMNQCRSDAPGTAIDEWADRYWDRDTGNVSKKSPPCPGWVGE